MNAEKLSKSNRAALAKFVAPWETWTPTLTWVGNNPTGLTVLARYKTQGKVVHFSVLISATDGNGATAVYITLPVVPKTNGIQPSVSVNSTINTSTGARYGYIRDNGTNDDCLVSPSPLTDDQAATIRISGIYEIE